MSKKIGELNSSYGKIEWFKNEDGSITNQRPVENTVLTKYIVTTSPSEYSAGTVFDNLKEAINHSKMISDMVGEKYYIIELGYIDEKMPPQYIFAHDDGKRIRIL